jgi:hypothetical protein
VHWAPGIPHALCFLKGASFMHTSGASRGENAKAYLQIESPIVIAREGGRSSIPERQ